MKYIFLLALVLVTNTAYAVDVTSYQRLNQSGTMAMYNVQLSENPVCSEGEWGLTLLNESTEVAKSQTISTASDHGTFTAFSLTDSPVTQTVVSCKGMSGDIANLEYNDGAVLFFLEEFKMTSSEALQEIITQIGIYGFQAGLILGAILALATAYLVFRFGWYQIQGIFQMRRWNKNKRNLLDEQFDD